MVTWSVRLSRKANDRSRQGRERERERERERKKERAREIKRERYMYDAGAISFSMRGILTFVFAADHDSRCKSIFDLSPGLLSASKFNLFRKQSKEIMTHPMVSVSLVFFLFMADVFSCLWVPVFLPRIN